MLDTGSPKRKGTDLFRLKITLLAVAISGAVVVGLGLYYLSVLRSVQLDRIDHEILALGESQLHVWHPRGHWVDLDESLLFIYGAERMKDLIVTVKDAKNQIFYKSAEWPEEVSESLFPDFDFKMESHRPASHDPPDDARDYWRPPLTLPADNGGQPGQSPIPSPYTPLYIKKPFFATVWAGGHPWRVGIMGNQHITILLGINLTHFYADSALFRRVFLFTLPLALLVLACGGWLISKRALEPVVAITRTAETISAQNLDQRIPASTADREFRRLVDVINHMLERLEKSFNLSIRFSADAAHELQTPLTILQGELEELVQHPPNGSHGQRCFSLLLDEVGRLKAIVQKLLLLARADARRLYLNVESVESQRAD